MSLLGRGGGQFTGVDESRGCAAASVPLTAASLLRVGIAGGVPLDQTRPRSALEL